MNEKEISIDKIEIGMEISSNVVNKYKQVLIRANERFEEKHRFILKTWGIQTVKVIIDDEVDQDEISEEKKEKAWNILSRRMNWKARNENEKELIKIAINRLCEKMTE